MSNFRRARVAGGVYFFTVVTHRRMRLFDDTVRVNVLRSAFRRVMCERPFEVDAMVVLPDHLHCIWRLPDGDDDYSGRWRWIKTTVTRRIREIDPRFESRALWQPRFWEHAIQDAADWRRHVDYVHYNPVKHGLVAHARDWPWSSFRRCVQRGWYDSSWGSSEPPTIARMCLE